jgi:ADP-heptose:LPS heptosyltransferase
VPTHDGLRDQIQVMPSCNVRVLAARISGLNVLLGNDSGPRHLASALGVPTVTLFGPEHPLEWHPYSVDRHPRLFIEPLPCRKNAEPGSPPWCGLQECIIEAHQCMTRIGSDEVFTEVKRVFESHGKDLGI